MRVEFDFTDMLGYEHSFKVPGFTCTFGTALDDTTVGNCAPRKFRMTVEIPLQPYPGLPFFRFARQQSDLVYGDSEDNPVKARLRVYKGDSYREESLQVIDIKRFWITDLEWAVTPGDSMFFLNVTLVAGSVTISGEELVHHRRNNYFEEFQEK